MKATRGKFKLAGYVVGTNKDSFYKETTFEKTGSVKKEISFGVKTSNENVVYLKIEQFVPKDIKKAEAVFQKYDSKTKTNETKTVPYLKRKDFKEEGFQPRFGISVGLDTDGKKLIKTTMFALDAIEELSEKLKEDMCVYVEGDTEFTKYVNQKGEVKVYSNFKPTRVWLSSKDIDLDAEDFKELNVFQQDIVFIGVDKTEEKFEGKVKFAIESKIVNNKKDEDKKAYDEVINFEFFTTDDSLAKTFKNTKLIKPYTKIQVLGKIVNTVDEETVEEVDAWGDGNVEFKTTGKPSRKELQITTALPSTINIEDYTEELVEKAQKTREDYGKSDTNDSWGATKSDSTEDDEDDPWS